MTSLPPAAAETTVRPIPVELIDDDPAHPRVAPEADGEALERLAWSLVEFGQVQPAVVRPGPEPGRYTIVVGGRRRRAAELVGLPTLLAVVEPEPDGGDRPGDAEAWRLGVQLAENLAREGLNPIDQARAFRALMDRNGWSGRRLADAVGLNQSTVSRALALLDLPESERLHVAEGRLAPDRARRNARRGARAEVRDDEAEALANRDVKAAAAANRLVFRTALGLVSFEPNDPSRADRDDVVDALLRVVEHLRGLRNALLGGIADRDEGDEDEGDAPLGNGA